MTTTILKVDGMTCMGCVASVTRALKALDGVAKVEVALDAGRATIDHDAERASAEQLKAAIEAAGFEAANADGH